MFKVTWTDRNGENGHTIISDETDARALFAIIVRAAIRGQYQDVLLIGRDGNFLDTWGT